MPQSSNELSIREYTTESQLRHPSALFTSMFEDLLASRELAWRLTVRDINAQYRQTALGILWAFILPLVNTVTWVFLNKSGVVRIEGTALPYTLHVLSGTMLWSIFVDAANAPLNGMTEAKQILAKVNFPREALILSGVYKTLFNGAIKIALVFVVMLTMGIMPGWPTLLFPFGVLSLVLAGTLVGVLLAPLGVLYRDIGKSIPLLMQFAMYLTPVVFVMPTTGWASVIFKANPITPLLLASRDWLTGSWPDSLGYFLIVNIVVLGGNFLAWIAFRVAMPILIERMSA